jgi:chemotaxis protein MotB
MKENKLKIHIVEEHENDELWAISYGDMITLLLSFFVIFFSTDFKKNKQDEIDNHLLNSFKVEHQTLKKDRIPASINEGIDKNKIVDAKFNFSDFAKVTKLDDRIIVTFENVTFFKSGATDPTPEGMQIIKEFSQKYLPYASMYKLSIKSFTDKQQVNQNKHRYKDNMELSALRSISALRLMQSTGMPVNRMDIAGYGEMQLLASVIGKEKFEKLNQNEIQNLSRTIMFIIKHDNERSLL